MHALAKLATSADSFASRFAGLRCRRLFLLLAAPPLSAARLTSFRRRGRTGLRVYGNAITCLFTSYCCYAVDVARR